MSFRSSLKTHRYLFLVCMTYMACAVAAGLIYKIDFVRFAQLAVTPFLLQFLLVPVLMALGVVWVLWQNRHDAARGPLRWLMNGFKESDAMWSAYISSSRFYDGLAALFSILPLMIFFCIFKSLFPLIASGNIDATLAHLDALIHGGLYPHDYLMPLFAHFPAAEKMAEYSYIAWFPVMMAANVYCLFFDRNAVRRKTYLWSFTLCWIFSGTILAIALYSMGPVYYSFANPGGTNPYQDLVTWLSTVNEGNPAFTLEAAMYLHEVVTDGTYPDVNGISAMPSQHVAIAWLVMLYAFSVKRIWGVISLIFASAVFISSIVLGWHYAVDGYAGIAIVSVLWMTVSFILRKIEMGKHTS